jgi:hypothetical protein
MDNCSILYSKSFKSINAMIIYMVITKNEIEKEETIVGSSIKSS